VFFLLFCATCLVNKDVYKRPELSQFGVFFTRRRNSESDDYATPPNSARRKCCRWRKYRQFGCNLSKSTRFTIFSIPRRSVVLHYGRLTSYRQVAIGLIAFGRVGGGVSSDSTPRVIGWSHWRPLRYFSFLCMYVFCVSLSVLTLQHGEVNLVGLKRDL